MFKSSSPAMLWSLALGGALLVGCGKEEEKPMGTGDGTPPPPATQPGEVDPPGPTTRPGEDATGLVPDAPDMTPGTPTLPGIPSIPGAGEAEAAAGRVLPSTRPATGPTTLPGVTLPGVPNIPDTDTDADNK